MLIVWCISLHVLLTTPGWSSHLDEQCLQKLSPEHQNNPCTSTHWWNQCAGLEFSEPIAKRHANSNLYRLDYSVCVTSIDSACCSIIGSQLWYTICVYQSIAEWSLQDTIYCCGSLLHAIGFSWSQGCQYQHISWSRKWLQTSLSTIIFIKADERYARAVLQNSEWQLNKL